MHTPQTRTLKGEEQSASEQTRYARFARASLLHVLDQISLQIVLEIEGGERILSVLSGLQGELERVVRVPELGVQRPANASVQALELHLPRVRQVPEHTVDRLGLVELVLALGNVLRADSPLTEIDVALREGGGLASHKQRRPTHHV